LFNQAAEDALVSLPFYMIPRSQNGNGQTVEVRAWYSDSNPPGDGVQLHWGGIPAITDYDPVTEGLATETNPSIRRIVLTDTDANKSITALFLPETHSADWEIVETPFIISDGERVRFTEYYYPPGENKYRCEKTGDPPQPDGYTVVLVNSDGEIEVDCVPHAGDYDGGTGRQDWQISLSEFLRIVQFFNVGPAGGNLDGDLQSYHFCPTAGTEDGYCPGDPPQAP
jgi:hypothetical protein